MSRVSALLGRDKGVENGHEFRYAPGREEPETFHQDLAILVRQHVSQADDPSPRHLRVRLLKPGRHLPCSFSDDEELPLDRRAEQLVLLKPRVLRVQDELVD
jgi:hypothetical protein